MNVLVVIRSWGIGGEQRAVSLIGAGLSARGHHVTILVLANRPNGRAIVLDREVDVLYASTRPGRWALLSKIRAVRVALANSRFDMIVGFGAGAAIAACLASPWGRVPVVVCERNDPREVPRSWWPVRSLAYSRATGAVFQTSDASDCFDDQFFRLRAVIPNPVHPLARRAKSAVRKPVVVNTSRLTPAKNHRLLIESFARIAEAHPQYSLKIYGDGPMKHHLLRLVDQVGMSHRIQICAPSSSILDEIAECQIFVLSSNHEGFPNSLAEAMCLGLSCISTDCRIGGPRAMIDDGVNGRLVPVGNVDAMSSALDAYMSSPAHADELGQAATALGIVLDADAVADRWHHFLGEVADSAKRK